MNKRSRVPRSIIIFVACYLAAAIAAAIFQQDWQFLSFYLPFFVLFMVIVTIIQRCVGFPRGLQWGLALWGAMHLAGEMVPLPAGWLYGGTEKVLDAWWLVEDYLTYDHFVHGYGFGVATWLCWEALRSNIYHRFGRKLYPSAGMIAVAMLGGMGLGAVSEIIEFLAVLNLEITKIGGYHHTGWDLVANLVGCVFAGVVIFFRG